MSTRRERRRQEKEQRSTQDRAMARARLRRHAALALGSVTLALGSLALWQRLTPSDGPVPQTPVSASSPAPASLTERKPGEKTLEEVNSELASAAQKQRKSKEWIWAETGKISSIIEAYRALESQKGGPQREQRVALINVLGRTIKPRKEWSEGFTDESARQAVEFLAGLLKSGGAPGPELSAAVVSLAAYGKALPEHKARVERLLVEYYAADSRPGPRGECLLKLGELHSKEGLPLVSRNAAGSDLSLQRAALYALGYYLDEPSTNARARSALLAAAHAAPPTAGPLALKLLASRGATEAAALVPQALRKGASPAEVEAGAFAAGKLRLKRFRPLLVDRLGDQDLQMLRQAIDAAIQEIDRK